MQHPCRTCKGVGTVEKDTSRDVEISRFVDHGDSLEFKSQGHQSAYTNMVGSEDGSLFVKV